MAGSLFCKCGSEEVGAYCTAWHTTVDYEILWNPRLILASDYAAPTVGIRGLGDPSLRLSILAILKGLDSPTASCLPSTHCGH